MPNPPKIPHPPGQLPIAAEVTARIRRHRLARGLSTQALVDAMVADGYSIQRATMANHEGGRHQSLPVDLVHSAARALGLPLMALFTDVPCDACHSYPPPGFACNACGMGA